jgi:hypothetical protein
VNLVDPEKNCNGQSHGGMVAEKCASPDAQLCRFTIMLTTTDPEKNSVFAVASLFNPAINS